jgi:hypothetical protein
MGAASTRLAAQEAVDTGRTAPDGGAGPSRDEVDARVAFAIRDAVGFLWSTQQGDGRWVEEPLEARSPGGLTALAVYALHAAGTEVDDHRLQLAIHALEDREEMNTVFLRAATLRLWCALDPQRYGRAATEDARFLTTHQHREGAWGVGMRTGDAPGRDRVDHAHTELALLALREAAEVGAEIGQGTWKRAEAYWIATQNPDGGWGDDPATDEPSTSRAGESTGERTAGGLAALSLLHERLYPDLAMPFNGRFAARCGKPADRDRNLLTATARAEGWMATHLRLGDGPAERSSSAGGSTDGPSVDELLAVSRWGAGKGIQRVGALDWARRVTLELLRRQKPDGSWGTARETCVGLLALLDANAPVLVNKLRYGDGDGWNTAPRDAASLVEGYSRRTGTPFGWRVVDARSSPRDLYDAPVLLITGHDAPALCEEEVEALTTYVRAGGTILAVACCSKTDFANGVLVLFEKALPNSEAAPLEPEHPLWNVDAAIEPGQDVLGVSNGCRADVIILTNGACTAWHQRRRKEFARHFDIGLSALRYAAGGAEPRARITPPPTAGDRLGAFREVTVARLAHGGDWWTDEAALPRLDHALRGRIGLGVKELEAAPPERVERVRPDVVWVTGHRFVAPSVPGTEGIHRYLERGGTLFASSCCGRTEFQRSFQQWAVQTFGEDRWVPIPSTDPLMRGQVSGGLGSPLHGLQYRQSQPRGVPARLDWPLLYGVREGDRWIMVSSPYDVTCAVAAHPCAGCVGYTPVDAQALFANVLLSPRSAASTARDANADAGSPCP